MALPIFVFGGNTMQETTAIEQDQPVGAPLNSTSAPAPTMTLCSYRSKLPREELSRVKTACPVASIPIRTLTPRCFSSR